MKLTRYKKIGIGTADERVTLRLTFAESGQDSAMTLADRVLEFERAFARQDGEGSIKHWEPSDKNTRYSVATAHADAFLAEFNKEFN